MWIIEVNFIGHWFTHRVPDRRQPAFCFNRRGAHWQPPQLCHLLGT